MNINRKRLVENLSRLVRIPSWQECDTIAAFVIAELRKAGVAGAHRDRAGNVIAALGRGGPGLLLNAHLDTVPPGDFRGDPFGGKVVRGRLWGRGSSDDKAGVAAMIEIARLLSTRRLNQRLTLAFTVWEESTGPGLNGAHQVARDVRAARCIVLESSMSPSGRAMGVNVGCKGAMNLAITVKGRAFHSAQPQRGQNAVYRAAEVVAAFRKIFDPATMPRRSYRVGGREVVMQEFATITEIEATQGVNVIPGSCLLRANCRLLPDGDDREIVRRMHKLTASLPRGWITWRRQRRILGHICEDAAFIETCRAAVRQAGLKATTGIVAGRLDTTIFQREGGIQSLEMGPGTLGVAHTRDEFVTVESLVTGTGAALAAVESIVCD